MQNEIRKSFIITFKAKDKRPDRDKDKLEIVSASVTQPITFLTRHRCSRAPQ